MKVLTQKHKIYPVYFSKHNNNLQLSNLINFQVKIYSYKFDEERHMTINQWQTFSQVR